MLNIISYCLQIAGFIFLILGYKRNDKKLMLIAAFMIWFGASFDSIALATGDFARGFSDGYHEGMSKK